MAKSVKKPLGRASFGATGRGRTAPNLYIITDHHPLSNLPRCKLTDIQMPKEVSVFAIFMRNLRRFMDEVCQRAARPTVTSAGTA